MKHLADLGHRNILAISSEPPSVSTIQRLNGWKDAMRELNVPNYQRLFVDCSVRSPASIRSRAPMKVSLLAGQ